jgi:hypothetical protein
MQLLGQNAEGRNLIWFILFFYVSNQFRDFSILIVPFHICLGNDGWCLFSGKLENKKEN